MNWRFKQENPLHGFYSTAKGSRVEMRCEVFEVIRFTALFSSDAFFVLFEDFRILGHRLAT